MDIARLKKEQMITQEIIDDDFQTMKDMLDRINEKMKTHLNKKEVMAYYKPIRGMIYEAWQDLCEHKMPTFTPKEK